MIENSIHAGLQGGIGRKSWNAEQITRFSGSNKNRLAQTILDFSEQNGIISAEDRKNKLTTVQRYLSNVLIKDALGIDASVPDDISRNRPSEDFVLLLKKFIDDLLKGVVNSRARKPDIDGYARTLNTTEGVSGKRVPPHSIKDVKKKKGREAKFDGNSKVKKPTMPRTIRHSQEIQNSLDKVASTKLST